MQVISPITEMKKQRLRQIEVIAGVNKYQLAQSTELLSQMLAPRPLLGGPPRLQQEGLRPDSALAVLSQESVTPPP